MENCIVETKAGQEKSKFLSNFTNLKLTPIVLLLSMFATMGVLVSASCSHAANRESAAWKRAMSNGSPAAYMDFHRAYPNSKHLTVLRADVDSDFSMSISVNGAGYGTATGGPVQINVSGHPELSGGYDVKTAADLGIGAKVNADGYIVMDNRLLKNVELFIAQIGGKPRIVAAKPFIRAEANQALPVRSESSGIQQETSEKSGKTDSACADKCTSQYNKGEFKAGITIEDCIKETCK